MSEYVSDCCSAEARQTEFPIPSPLNEECKWEKGYRCEKCHMPCNPKPKTEGKKTMSESMDEAKARDMTGKRTECILKKDEKKERK